jgi:pyruvate dehydrogenase E1 component alpha subunit
MTYRWRGHVGPSYDLEHNIRTREELELWMERDPIKRLREQLAEDGVLSDEERTRIDAEVDQEVAAAIDFARKSPFPAVEELLDNVYAG